MKHGPQNPDSVSRTTLPYGPVPEHMRAPSSARHVASRSAWAATLLTILLAVAACSWTVWQRYQRGLRSTQSELAGLHDARARTASELSALHKAKVLLAQDLQMAKAKERELSVRLAATESRLEVFEEEHTFVEAELVELRRIAGAFESMVNSDSLDVSYRRGRMVVELPAQLLFPSGGADLTPEGTLALKQVAEVLRGVDGRRFLVAGHTDSVRVSSAHFENNWELSVARALHVTEALIAAGVKPRQLMAAGRAHYEPVASNASERGRRKNRRIEIVLEPYLAEIDPRLEGDGEVDFD